ncbi:MAG: PDZ domain-containing protein [candidate division WOR-3 bacterium]
MKRWIFLVLVLLLGTTVGLPAKRAKPRETERGWLGVVTENLSPAMLVALGIEHGVLIGEVVEDGPAAKAGLRMGDVIVQIDSEKVVDASDLRYLVREKPNQKVRVQLWRRGKKEEVSVLLGARRPEFEPFFDWEPIPKEALRAAREALREVRPRIRRSVELYDAATDSLRQEIEELRREIRELREKLEHQKKRE